MKKILQTTIEQVHWDNTQDYQDGNGLQSGRGGWVLSYMAYMRTCRWTGYGFWPLCPKQGM